MHSPPIEKLIRIFKRFPGIGERQAARFAYHLALEDRAARADLAQAITALDAVRSCPECFRTLGGDICALCADPGRDHSTIVVLENDTDLDAFERAGVINARYFVLGGTLSEFGEGANTGQLRFRVFYERIKTAAAVREVIIALDATPEGNFTARYIEKILEPLQKTRSIKIVRLGRGISTGAEIEYLNRDTLKDALDNRR
ncbi:MAG: recombination protein RecR [Candidatus Niyogibacteria bacterium]|nr:recombination protein RecR [Candidatus Niyogibacteria bacterium]